MGRGLVIPIANEQQREYAMARANAAVAKGVQQGAVELEVRYAARELSQNAKFHALIADIHRQCFRGYSAEGVKAVLVNQFALEMVEQGTPLTRPGEKVWDWKTQEAVYVRPTTTKFRASEAAQFIEFLYATGVELGVTWSEQANAIYDSYREARRA